MQINLRVARGGISCLDDPNLVSAGRSCEWVDYALNYARVGFKEILLMQIVVCAGTTPLEIIHLA
jgi:hypothetical protein